MPFGQRLKARLIGIAEWSPYFRASYEHAATTPLPLGSPPTITGFPINEGLSILSTETKKRQDPDEILFS